MACWRAFTMDDALLVLLWLAMAMVGVAMAVWLHRVGVAATYVRDLVHVGAGAWVFGWSAWQHPAVPVLVAAVVAGGSAGVPGLAKRYRLLAGLRGALADTDETWQGVAQYGMVFFAFTLCAFVASDLRAAAGASLLALAWGDGLGGAVGRRLGTHRFRAPWAKAKTLEGSMVVAVMSAAAVLVFLSWMDATVDPAAVVGAGAVAACAEALAPRGSDNLAVPTSVFVWLLAWSRG